MSDTLTLTNQRYANKGTITITIEQECDSEPLTLLTPAEVSKRYSIPIGRLSKLRNLTTTGPTFSRSVTGKITYLAADIEAWLAAPKVKTYPGWQKKGLAR